MELSYDQYPSFEKQFCICDSQVDTIICEKNSVCFVFSKGFFKIEGDGFVPTTTGHIEFNDCSPEEFNCHIIQREASQFGAKLYGNPISLSELARMLSEDDRKIEMFLELYDYAYLHWRGVLLPHKEQGLSDNIVIETSGCFKITYSWE